MSELASFMARFGRQTKSYWFYNDTVEIRFDKKEHVYYLVQADKSLKALDSVSQVCHIIDKSKALVPWACKQMMLKLFTLVPKTVTKSGTEAVIMPYDEFEKAVVSAKSAHKEKLEDAGEVGNAVHDWVERYIQLRINGHSTEEILSQFPYDPRAENGCTAALGWMAAHNVRWIATEKKIYSREFEIPGTMDGIARTDSCTDKKCCSQEFKDHLSVIDWKTSNNLYLEYIMQVATYRVAEQEENGTAYDDAWIIRLGKEDGEFEPWHLDLEALELGWKAFRSAQELTQWVKALEEWLAGRKAAQRAIKKVEAAERKESKLRDACAGAAKYKGIRPPRCNGGDPCKSCIHRFVDRKWLGVVFSPMLTAGGKDEELARVQTAEPDAGSLVLEDFDGCQPSAVTPGRNPARLAGSGHSGGTRDLLRDLLQAAKA
jgi:hypothetical protein